MAAHVDILEQRESLGRPLAASVAMHALVFGSIVVYTAVSARGHVLWGNPHSLGGGAAVGITAVSQIPLPARSGAANPLANDTESRVPMPPKPQPKTAPAPEPNAIAIPGRQSHQRQTRPKSKYQPYQAQPERRNQLYSGVGQALSSNMFGAPTGSGGVGLGPGSAFGERFGWYRDLLEQRVAQKWRTNDVDARLQTAPPVIITFDIMRDGSLRNVKILQGSGNRALDYSSERAIYEAAPFPPLPQGYDRDSAQIEFWFQLNR